MRILLKNTLFTLIICLVLSKTVVGIQADFSEGDSTAIINLCDEIDNSSDDWNKGLKDLENAKKLVGENCNFCLGRIYQSFGTIFYKQDILDSSVFYYKNSYLIFAGTGDTIPALESIENLVLIFLNNYSFDDAIDYSILGIEYAGKAGLEKRKADFYVYLGESYDELGRVRKSADALITALSIYSSLNDSIGISASLISLGVIFTYDENFTDAIDYTERALVISRKLGLQYEVAASLNNLGYIYSAMEQPGTALEYYVESLKIDRELNDKEGIAISLNNIGDTYKELGDTVLAMSYYTQSYEASVPDNISLLAIINNNRAEVELGRGNLRAALNHGLEGVEYADQTHIPDIILGLYDILQKVYGEMGRYENAYYYSTKYRTLYDSVFSLKKTRAIHELKAKYNDELQRSEISDLKQKNSDETELRQYLFAAIIAVSILIISMFIVNSIIRVSRRQLKKQKKFYENLLEFSEDFIFVVDKNGTTKYISPNYERKIGREISGRIGKNTFEFIHPEDVDQVKAEFFGLVKDKKPRSIDFRMKDAYDDWIAIHAYGQNFINDPIIDGIIVNFWDISPLKRKEELISQSEVKFREIFNAFPDIYFQADTKGIITEISPSVNDMLGYTSEELLGVGPGEYHHFIEDWKKIVARFQTNNFIDDHDTNVRTKDGKIIHCSFSAENSYDHNSKINGIKGVVRDISPRIKNQQKLQESQRKLKEANHSKEKILSIIAHDLIGPIGTNKSIVDLIVSQVDELTHEEVVTLITSLKPSLDSTYSLIENLLSWARIQQNKLKPNFEVIEIHRVLRLIFELVKGQTEKKLIDLNLTGEEKVKILGDPNQVDIVFRNLISNAIKFSEKGMEINVTIESDEDNAIITVLDKGVGMNKTQLDRILSGKGIDEVKRGTDNEKGTGFGLVIISEFVKNNKGKLEIESEEGKGSAFKVYLPLSKG